ncbi:endonuclease exonuclease phosphatase [Colletotrichum tofieldiae]|nr:endonuclease exonuclease phosphatase [Colletotrichum tofieldiae]
MNKHGESAAAPGPSPPRTISPAPKPEFLRDAKASSESLPVPRDRESVRVSQLRHYLLRYTSPSPARLAALWVSLRL